jgi:hypothetical protein
MTAPPSNQPDSQPPVNDPHAENLLRSLRRKEGTWLEWGKTCQQLQKAGYTPQQIFEGTGFEPIQQNQIIVAAQVYNSILEGGTSEAVQSRFERTGSDTLYALRILNQKERAAAAALIVEKGIDSEGAHEVAKALKEFSRRSEPPPGFTEYPGDAVSYYYWKLARQQTDLQSRSRLIALGLRFASSDTARQQIETLLTDFTVTRSVEAPLLPVYRLETAADVPKIVPVVGKMPLAAADFKAVPWVAEEGPFGIVKFSGTGAWVPVPGWQVVLAADDPVAILTDSDQLPTPPGGGIEEVLVMVDRAYRQWDAYSYFAVDQSGQLQIDWFETEPTAPILGKVLLVMRPKRVLDEDYNKDPWQLDE